MWPFQSLEKINENRQKSLQKKLDSFLEKNSKFFGYMCFDGKNMVVYKRAVINKGEIFLQYINSDTPKELVNVIPLNHFKLMYFDYENEIERQRNRFIQLKDEINKLGFEIIQYKT